MTNMRVVSFDLFDTLVCRVFSDQAGLFSAIGDEAKREGLVSNNIDFAKERERAEALARKREYPDEISLTDIYEIFALNNQVSSVNDLIEVEEGVELKTCVAICDGVKLLEEKRESADALVLITDTYHSEEFIKRLLAKLEIGKFSHIFISSARKKTKASGDLFSIVLDTCGCKPADLEHYGDNFKSDFINPIRMGVRAKWLDSDHLPHDGASALAEKALRRHNVTADAYHLDKGVNHISNPSLWKIGYHLLGPLLFGFNKWLKEDMTRRHLDSALFLSRDGRILMKAFEIMYPDMSSDYLYASRRSLVLPTDGLASTLAEQLLHMSLPKKIAPVELFTRLGLNADDAYTLMISNGVEPFEACNVSDLSKMEDMSNAYKDVVPSIRRKNERDAQALGGYLLSMIEDGKSYAIVDIGWHGSMQLALKKQLVNMGVKAEITGYYVGLYPKNGSSERNHMMGYLFDGKSGAGEASDEVLYNALFELLFMTDHGSVLRFEKREDEYLPVFSEYEYSDYDENPILEIQSGALDFVEKAVCDDYSSFKILRKEDILQSIKRLGLNPTKEEAELLGNLPFYDTGMQRLADPRVIVEYFENPRSLFCDFRKSLWKPAFLRRLFGTKLPFGEMLSEVKRKR